MSIQVGTKSIGGSFDHVGAYQATFGPLAPGTRYVDIDVKSYGADQRSGDFDMRAKLNEVAKVGLKAFTTTAGGAGTAGYAMIPIYVDPVIVDRSRKWTPLVELIPRVTNMGLTADYNIITAKGGGFTAAEQAAFSDRDNTYDRASTSIKFLYAVSGATGPANSGTPSYMMAGLGGSAGAAGPFSDVSASNAMQIEVLAATRAIKELEENLIINGNSSTDATQYDGIIAILGATNTVDKNTSALSLNDYNTAAQYAFDDGGRPNLGVCSSAVFTDTLNLLTAKIGFLQATRQVFWGFTAIVLNTLVGEIPLIPSMFLSNVTGSKAAYLLDLGVVEMRVLQDLTFERLGKNNDVDRFFLKIYEALIIRAPAFCASITEIA